MQTPGPQLKAARRAVMILFFLNGALFATWVSRVPAIKAAHHLSNAALGFALLSIALGAVTAMPMAGWFSARIGSAQVCRITVAAYCVLLPSLALIPSLPMLVLTLFGFGAFHGALDVAMNAQAVEVEQQYQQPIMSSFHALWSTGGLTGAALGGLLAGQGMRPPAHFVLASAVFGGAAALAAPHLWKMQLTSAPGEVERKAGVFLHPSSGLLMLGAIALCVMMGEGAMADWSAVYLRANILTSERVAAWGYAAFSLAMAGGRYFGDWLAAQFGSALLVRAGGTLAAAGLMLALAFPRAPVVLIGFAMVGLGFATVVPMVFSAAGQRKEVSPGVAIASVSALGYLGFLVGPPLIGLAAQWLGLRTALGIIIVTSLMAAALPLSGQVDNPEKCRPAAGEVGGE